MRPITITLFVDQMAKGTGARFDDGTWKPGCWLGIVKDGHHVKYHHLTTCETRQEAEQALRREYGLKGKRIKWEPTSPKQVAWQAHLVI